MLDATIFNALYVWSADWLSGQWLGGLGRSELVIWVTGLQTPILVVTVGAAAPIWSRVLISDVFSGGPSHFLFLSRSPVPLTSLLSSIVPTRFHSSLAPLLSRIRLFHPVTPAGPMAIS